MFNSDDFKVFEDPTLEGRLDKIRKVIDPKFEVMGADLLQKYQANFDEQLYVHIAKHLRRHKNPPPDTWFAISTNKRGYKAYPHIEIGFWPECIFTNISFLTEMTSRTEIIKILNKSISFDNNLGISNEHTKSSLEPMTKEKFAQATKRYLEVKSADLVIGFTYKKDSFDNEVMLNELPVLFNLLRQFNQ